MSVSPYLYFDGDCAAAFAFYAEVLGTAPPYVMTYGQAPVEHEMSPDLKDKVIHASLTVGNTVLMASDAPPDRYSKPAGFSVSYTAASVEDGAAKFAALAEGGAVILPYGKTFWSDGFGMLVDKFGISWMVSQPPVAA